MIINVTDFMIKYRSVLTSEMKTDIQTMADNIYEVARRNALREAAKIAEQVDSGTYTITTADILRDMK